MLSGHDHSLWKSEREKRSDIMRKLGRFLYPVKNSSFVVFFYQWLLSLISRRSNFTITTAYSNGLH
jgi:hypothetical protein